MYVLDQLVTKTYIGMCFSLHGIQIQFDIITLHTWNVSSATTVTQGREKNDEFILVSSWYQ
jgi:hypothetical protein